MTLPDTVIDNALRMLPPCTFGATKEKVQAIAQDERCPAVVLQSIISNDPGMSFAVLSRANFSLRYGDEGFLGVAASMNHLGVPATAALLNELDVIPEHLASPMASFWSSANAAATLTRLLTKRCGAGIFPDSLSREFMVLSGLLYDLGNITALRIFGKQYSKAAQRLLAGEQQFHLLVKEELGVDPAGLGFRYATLWGLPKPISDNISLQYRDPDQDDPSPIEAIMGIVRNLCNACGHTSGVDHFVGEISYRWLNALGLKNRDITNLINDFYREMRHLEFYELPSPEHAI